MNECRYCRKMRDEWDCHGQECRTAIARALRRQRLGLPMVPNLIRNEIPLARPRGRSLPSCGASACALAVPTKSAGIVRRPMISKATSRQTGHQSIVRFQRPKPRPAGLTHAPNLNPVWPFMRRIAMRAAFNFIGGKTGVSMPSGTSHARAHAASQWRQ